MAFISLSSRKLYPKNLYKYPSMPHHVHLPVNCSDHSTCPPDHWIGGKPQIDYPHHVEFDGSTGMWGYTRLSKEEIDDLKILENHMGGIIND